MTPPITYGQLLQAMEEDVAWARVYPPKRVSTKSEEWHNPIEKRESLKRWGDEKVKRAMPGYRFVLVWLE